MSTNRENPVPFAEGNDPYSAHLFEVVFGILSTVLLEQRTSLNCRAV